MFIFCTNKKRRDFFLIFFCSRLQGGGKVKNCGQITFRLSCIKTERDAGLFMLAEERNSTIMGSVCLIGVQVAGVQILH